MAEGTTYFGLMGVDPVRLQIDGAALEKEFYRQSRRLHPDRFAARPKEEQEAALRQSSELNDAYRTLKDPIARTQYLLRLEGIEMEEQSKAATDAARATGGTKKQVAPPELLEEAFELNMQLEEMRANKKFGEDDPQLRLEDIEMEEQSKAATDAARATGGTKKQVAPPELLEEAFELNMQLEEMRANKKFGEDDPQLRKDLEGAKRNFEGMLAATQTDLEGLWARWDGATDAAEKTAARDGMVALLNRRSYVRNLVRDVNEALD